MQPNLKETTLITSTNAMSPCNIVKPMPHIEFEWTEILPGGCNSSDSFPVLPTPPQRSSLHRHQKLHEVHQSWPNNTCPVNLVASTHRQREKNTWPRWDSNDSLYPEICTAYQKVNLGFVSKSLIAEKSKMVLHKQSINFACTLLGT
jgi:hypothetical protein